MEYKQIFTFYLSTNNQPCVNAIFIVRRNKKLSRFQTWKVSKMIENQPKIFNFFEKLKGNFEIFWKFFKILSKFSRKFGEKFRKLWKYAFVGVRGRSPPKLAKLLKTVEKSTETRKLLKNFMNYGSIFI